MSDSLFVQELFPGNPIRLFLAAGVLEKDYTGPRDRKEIRSRLEEALHAAAEELKGKTFLEFDRVSLCGTEGRFIMNTHESPLYADGHYYVMEKLALMPISLTLDSSAVQDVTLGFRADPLIVILNGRIVYDSDAQPAKRKPREYTFEHGGQWVNQRPEKPEEQEVTMRLNAGENTLFALTGKIDRGTGISFSAALLSAEAAVFAKIPLNMPEEIRSEIAHSQRETYLLDDCIRPGEDPVVHIGRAPLRNCRTLLSVVQPDGSRIGRIEASAEENGQWLRIPALTRIGKHQLIVSWSLPDETILTESVLPFTRVDLLQAYPGPENYENRRQILLEKLAEKDDLLALYRLGRYREITLPLVDRLASRIDRWADCADFDLLPLLWIAYEDREEKHLPEEIHDRIRKAALSFRYWVDEPNLSSMFYCSENHRIGFHVTEYLAGLLYPLDVFENTQQNGMYHSLKGRMHLMEWLSQRCRAGFDEPHSDNYLPVTLSALLVLREVLPRDEYPLQNMVNVLLCFLTFIFAVSDFHGIMATPRARSYNETLRSRLFSSAGGVFWQLFGDAEANADKVNSELAFSPYVPPEGLLRLAEDHGPADFFFKQGIFHFDKHNADFAIRRTPEYMIGGVRDHNVGLKDMHFISAMAALPNDIEIFFSAPDNVAEGSGLRPDYWAGQAFLPRVLMYGRTLAVIWHNVNDSNIWMTHCHFNRHRFDEVVMRDGWTFGKSGDSYIGIYSTEPHAFRSEGPYAGRELVAYGNETIWLAECGCLREDGSFDLFMEKLLSSQCHFLTNEEREKLEGFPSDEPVFAFASPGSGVLEFGLSEGFTVDGREVPVPEYTVLCKYLSSRFGSGRFDYHVPGFTVTHWTYPMNS